MTIEDRSVAGFIRTMNSNKVALEIKVLEKVHDLVSQANRGPTSEIIDLAFATTGYGKADIPGGEVQAAGHCISVLVDYLTLRSTTGPTNESLEESLLALITNSVRLYAEVNLNRGARVPPLTQRS